MTDELFRLSYWLSKSLMLFGTIKMDYYWWYHDKISAAVNNYKLRIARLMHLELPLSEVYILPWIYKANFTYIVRASIDFEVLHHTILIMINYKRKTIVIKSAMLAVIFNKHTPLRLQFSVSSNLLQL